MPGTYAFTPNTNQPPLVANSESVTFTPEDLLDYNTVVSNVSVTVTSNSTPSSLTNLFVKVNPTASSIAFGQTLASSSLSGGVFTNSSGRAFTNAPGGFSGTLTFTNLGLTPVNVGSTNVWVIFTPTNPPNDFNSVTTTVPVAVAKAVPQLILGSGSLTNGQALSNATFSGSSAVNPNNGAAITALGTFAFVTPALVPNAGTTNVAVTFTPTGAAANDYTAVTNTTFSVTVAKDSPTLSVVIASGLKYGQALSASDLTNSKAINSFNKAAVAGTFAFTTPGSLPDAGTTPISVTFSPSNTANYLSGTTNANITVAMTTPLLTALGTNYLLVGNSLTSLTPQESAINPYNANLKANGVFAFTTNWVPTKAATNTVGVTFTSASTNYNNATNTAVVIVLTSQTPVTVSNVVVTPKTYDGTTNATLSLANYALLGLASGDSSGVQLTNVGGGFFSDTNAGSGKLVTATLAQRTQSGEILPGATAVDRHYLPAPADPHGQCCHLGYVGASRQPADLYLHLRRADPQRCRWRHQRLGWHQHRVRHQFGRVDSGHDQSARRDLCELCPASSQRGPLRQLQHYVWMGHADDHQQPKQRRVHLEHPAVIPRPNCKRGCHPDLAGRLCRHQPGGSIGPERRSGALLVPDSALYHSPADFGPDEFLLHHHELHPRGAVQHGFDQLDQS